MNPPLPRVVCDHCRLSQTDRGQDNCDHCGRILLHNICPLCETRISAWSTASGKTTKINNQNCHNSCLIDFRLKTGSDFRPAIAS